MDILEVVIEVTYVTIATIKSDLLYGLRIVFHQLSRLAHPDVPQVSPKCLANVAVEQAK
jgi:hypothetical protein